MKEIITILSLLILTIGCKSPKYTAKTKADLSKLCVYEFPYNPLPIDVKRDTTIIYNVIIKRDSIDCTDKQGIQYVDVLVPADTITITETITVDNPAQSFYILELEHRKEVLQTDLRKSLATRNKLWVLIVILAMVLTYRLFR